MYLSRVEIDDGNRRKVRDLTHLGVYHGWVEECFPEEISQGVRSRKLWRVDRLHGKRYLLLVSEEAPDLKRLEKYGVPDSAGTKNYDPFLSRIQAGSMYRFKVTLNPVISESMGAGKRGRVFPLIAADRQIEFFEKRAEQNGFRLLPGECEITERDFVKIRKGGKKLVELSRATYEGKLEVIDPASFRAALTEGIGKKKAYGFGLMTIIPVR